MFTRLTAGSISPTRPRGGSSWSATQCFMHELTFFAVKTRPAVREISAESGLFRRYCRTVHHLNDESDSFFAN